MVVDEYDPAIEFLIGALGLDLEAVSGVCHASHEKKRIARTKDCPHHWSTQEAEARGATQPWTFRVIM